MYIYLSNKYNIYNVYNNYWIKYHDYTQGNWLSSDGLAFLASGSPSESESWPSNSFAFGVRGGGAYLKKNPQMGVHLKMKSWRSYKPVDFMLKAWF